MINFDRVKKETDFYNFHTHTQYCDGHAEMREFVVAAINQGFKHLGFTPHSPIPFETSCNMDINDVEKYKSEFYGLKDEFKDQIELYFSMEIDFIDENWNANDSYFNGLGLDYKLSSVHFIPSFDNNELFIDVDGNFRAFRQKMNQYFHDDIESVVKSFYHQSMKMVEIGGFDIIGHFDKIGHNASYFEEGIENQEWYTKLVLDLFNAVMDKKLVIEINTKALKDHSRFFPNKRMFELLRKYNAPILINSDCHYPELMNAGRMEAFKILQ